MKKHIPENERMKRAYASLLEEADGKDEKSVDKILAAIWTFEQATGHKPFKSFTRDHAIKFKKVLDKTKNQRTGKPLTHATIDSTLRLVQEFFKWLAGQPGYKSKITYSDVRYFNNKLKNKRIAHTAKPRRIPSMSQAEHAFQAMPTNTVFERRDKAIFATLMLIGPRASAVRSLRIKHVNLRENHIYQYGGEVDTKNGKTINSWFPPLNPMYRDELERWYRYLVDELLFGPDDALFPKAARTIDPEGGFKYDTLSRDPFAQSGPICATIKTAFENVQMHPFTPHAFRTMLVMHYDEISPNRRTFKALSMNIGHSSEKTTMSAYMPVSEDAQRELVLGMNLK